MADISALAEAVVARDRTALGRAITLVESANPAHSEEARALLRALTPHSGQAMRVGITGMPGVGKSTFIDALGTRLTSSGHQVGVLAVDPSSTVHSGSVMGDKTRMARLANDPSAFIRPSPSSGALGGVGRHTRETMIVLEAAGYDVVLVETVGVGQSETLVDEMVDTFLVLSLPGAGDELQGIKKGVLELADLVVVNKSDGDQVEAAAVAAHDLEAALRIVTSPDAGWHPPVLTASALHDEGLDLVWGQVALHRDYLLESGELDRQRANQLVAWMWAMVDEAVLAQFHTNSSVRAHGPKLEEQVRATELSAAEAAEALLAAFQNDF